jgi:hypothetical protein
MIQLRACLDDYGLEGSRNQQETASTCELCEHLSSRPRVASSTIPGPQPSIITLPKVPHSTSCCAYVIEYVCVRKTMCKSGGRSAAHAGGDADGCGPLELPQTVRHVASAVTADAGGRPVVEGGLGGNGSCSRRVTASTKGCCLMCVYEVVAQVRRCAASCCLMYDAVRRGIGRGGCSHAGGLAQSEGWPRQSCLCDVMPSLPVCTAWPTGPTAAAVTRVYGLAPIHARHHTPRVGARMSSSMYVCVRVRARAGGTLRRTPGVMRTAAALTPHIVPDRAPRGVCCDGRCWWSSRRVGRGLG